MGFKFNPFTGTLDIAGSGSSSSQNFSYTTIEVGESVTVPSGQEMVHSLDLMVRGDLMVQGNTFQIPDNDSGFSWTTIPVGTTVRVPVNRVMFYFSPLNVLGNLMVSGTLKEVA